MNTADRSLVSLDSALRRRFSFEEMAPDSSKIIPASCDGVDLVKLFETINGRIKQHYDKEHMIGHSYLMNIKSIRDLAKTFRNKIIPLLQEYFYDNEDVIKSILSTAKGNTSPFYNSENEVDDSKIYDKNSYIKLYEKDLSDDNNGDSN